MKTQQLASETAPSHKYRIEIPNSVADLGLHPFALALYAHIKRRAGDAGVCYDGDRELADRANMSQSSVVRAKRELKRRGLIEARRVKGRDALCIVNVWQENFDKYAPRDASAERVSQTQTESHRLRVSLTDSNRVSQTQSESVRLTPPDPLIRIEEPIQEPSKEPIQEPSLSPRASNEARGHGDEPERERETGAKFKTRFSLEQVRACAAAKRLGAGWITEALYTGKHDWQIEEHANPPLPLPPVLVVNARDCPDCSGTNFVTRVRDGQAGVVKCDHAPLYARLRERAEEEASGRVSVSDRAPPGVRAG